jgi:hypothetical protein
VAKITGIGANLWVDQYNVSGDVGAVDSITSSRALLDVTSIEDDYMSRLPGLGDGSISFSGYFNPSAGGLHQSYGSAFGTAISIVTIALGTAIGSPAASIGGARASYNTTRGADGALAIQASAESGIGYGTDWGVLLAGRASATGTATTTVNNGTATASGAQAYLHITAVAAGTPTVLVEHSADNSSFSTLLTFTASSTAVAEYKATAAGATVEQYLRYNVTGGTATFALNVSRN